VEDWPNRDDRRTTVKFDRVTNRKWFKPDTKELPISSSYLHDGDTIDERRDVRLRGPSTRCKVRAVVYEGNLHLHPVPVLCRLVPEQMRSGVMAKTARVANDMVVRPSYNSTTLASLKPWALGRDLDTKLYISYVPISLQNLSSLHGV
jgi:hypothetical protein